LEGIVDLVVVLLVLAALWVSWVWALVDAVRQPAMAFRPTGISKGATVMLLLLTGGLGGIYYHLRVRRTVSEAARSLSPIERLMTRVPK